MSATGVQAALVALMVSALFLDVLNRKQIWFVIGIACGLAFLAQANHRRTRLTRRRTETSDHVPGTTAGWVAPAIEPG